MPEDMVKIKKSTENAGLCCDVNDDHYPYGTRLNFDNDLIDELDIGQLVPGDVVEVRAFAFVNSKSEYSTEENSDKDMSLQLTSVKVRREVSDKAKELYG